MPSGITHILLVKNLQNVLPDGKLKKILQSGRDFLQVGALGPDLPYASIADDDFFFSDSHEPFRDTDSSTNILFRRKMFQLL